MILGKYHFLLYYLAAAISPRMMITVTEALPGPRSGRPFHQ